MKNKFSSIICTAIGAVIVSAASCTKSAEIPLAEHPRPDFERKEWINLNGSWRFSFDSLSASEALARGDCSVMEKEILVPFPWGSPLSGVPDEGDRAWYSRNVRIPSSWKGKRVFIVAGASDYGTRAWFAGKELGLHEGGYTPFEFEVTGLIDWGTDQQILFDIEDYNDKSRQTGKQGYGNVRGIWQTVYLEARGLNYISSVHFFPDPDNSCVRAEIKTSETFAGGEAVMIRFPNHERKPMKLEVLPGTDSLSVIIPLQNQHLWSQDDPYLYDVEVSIRKDGRTLDKVKSYFGQRSISVVNLPGTDYPYIALNGKPVYMQLCLDQSYCAEGFYTFPSDEYMKRDMEISKNLGLTGNRIHIKTEIPRRLYWADKLGLLIMADIPNWWGLPNDKAFDDWEKCMREQVNRDFNHPCIFSWVNFNETWGLYEIKKPDTYLKETQEKVRDMYRLTKSLDPTRLVEDNSPCYNDHVETDINSWHAYRPGYEWDATIDEYDRNTYPGSPFNFTEGNVQGNQPMLNSECGNVWGYTGSAGDSDYTWDYHIMINAFRRHPKCAGWLYTEHHDVVNEWNGYVRYDRTPKYDGLYEFVKGMGIKDFHSRYYVQPLLPLFSVQHAGTDIDVTVHASMTTDMDPGPMLLSCSVDDCKRTEKKLEFIPYFNGECCSFTVRIPENNGLHTLALVLSDSKGNVLHRNFCCMKVEDGKTADDGISFSPDSFTDSHWSLKQSEVLGGLKVNGFGSGYFEYEVETGDLSGAKKVQLVFEASSKQLFKKDMDPDMDTSDLEFITGGGSFISSKSANSYPMTDSRYWDSVVEIKVNGIDCGSYYLPDDPADHRGVLSWAAQPHDHFLREAGSYGELICVNIPAEALKGSKMIIRFTVPKQKKGGGLALYSDSFGRYCIMPAIKINY